MSTRTSEPTTSGRKYLPSGVYHVVAIDRRRRSERRYDRFLVRWYDGSRQPQFKTFQVTRQIHEARPCDVAAARDAAIAFRQRYEECARRRIAFDEHCMDGWQYRADLANGLPPAINHNCQGGRWPAGMTASAVRLRIERHRYSGADGLAVTLRADVLEQLGWSARTRLHHAANADGRWLALRRPAATDAEKPHALSLVNVGLHAGGCRLRFPWTDPWPYPNQVDYDGTGIQLRGGELLIPPPAVDGAMGAPGKASIQPA